MNWPDWWHWEIELSPHLLKRMTERGFNETDLREMLQSAGGHRENHEPGRYVIETSHDGQPWEIIVEPSPAEQVLIIITAYEIS